jgi:hypothetical protein
MGVNKKQAQLFGSIRAADILISPFVAGWLIQPAVFLSFPREIKKHGNDYSNFSLFDYDDIMEL